MQTQLKSLGKFSLNNDHMILLEGRLRQNEIETDDDYFQIAQPKESSFYDYIVE